MVTYLSITSTGGRLGRIHWANTVPFKYGTIWGQVRWDRVWPATVEDEFSKMLRRIAESAWILGEQMAQIMVPVAKATEAFADLGRAMGAAGVEGDRSIR